MIARAQTLLSSGGVSIASIAFPLVIIDVRAMVAMRRRKRPSIAIVFTPVRTHTHTHEHGAHLLLFRSQRADNKVCQL